MKKKIRKTGLLTEQQLNEFITGIVKGIFMGKVKKIGKLMKDDPKFKKALDDYIDDTEDFRDELKRQGFTSVRDLEAAAKRIGSDHLMPDRSRQHFPDE